MSQIPTQSALHALMPKADAARWAGPLGDAMSRHFLTTPKRAAMFLAQLAHESSELTRLEEDLNYSARRLVEVWPSRFSRETASIYQHQPQRIANRVYALRLGNGSQASGDGWRYRGRGPIQLTGKANYGAAGRALGMDLLSHPDDVAADPMVGAEVAAWLFVKNGCIPHADLGDLANCTRAINGGMNGLYTPEGSSRWDYYRAACRELWA